MRALALAALAMLLMSCQDGGLAFLRGGDAAAPEATSAPADGDAATEPAQAEAAEPEGDAGAAEPATAPEPAQAAEPRTDSRSEAQVACEAQGGRFVNAGTTGARVCQTRTRDGNKVCTASSQCEGACLARSATCAPVTPLLGCNDIITDSGGMATVCID